MARRKSIKRMKGVEDFKAAIASDASLHMVSSSASSSKTHGNGSEGGGQHSYSHADKGKGKAVSTDSLDGDDISVSMYPKNETEAPYGPYHEKMQALTEQIEGLMTDERLLQDIIQSLHGMIVRLRLRLQHAQRRCVSASTAHLQTRRGPRSRKERAKKAAEAQANTQNRLRDLEGRADAADQQLMSASRRHDELAQQVAEIKDEIDEMVRLSGGEETLDEELVVDEMGGGATVADDDVVEFAVI
ncbi:hypothetical protein B0T17DRAFT_514886 [Bombardia bombarda]|uniref:Uncharacterized protein n=1 Tax=Bombardia bombarda TaxID=252184 RepID=A0AA39XJW7_9PEZI|nr:hypothetical protein B0T17DRAFT_514886 [Bombardia bombarda]